MADFPAILPALVPAGHGAVLCQTGAMRHVDHAEARAILKSGEALVANTAFVCGRMKIQPAPLYDVLELFAFLRPGVPVAPGVVALARVMGLGAPGTPEHGARALHEIARMLLAEAANAKESSKAAMRPFLAALAQARWPWAQPLAA